MQFIRVIMFRQILHLENRIERANNILKNLTLSEETALEMIRSDKESDRYYAKKSIYTAMHAALLQDNAVDLLIVAENSSAGRQAVILCASANGS